MERVSAKYIERTVIEKEPIVSETLLRSPASLALELGALSMRFARVERVPRYEDGRRESDVEHSFMLAMVATEIAYSLYPQANIGLIGEYARVHDLIEIAVGDVATFNLTPEELATKEAVEHSALAAFLETLPPYTAKLLRRYESQLDIESRLVKAVDKLLPVVVDILGQGKRVMEEDYGVSSPEDLKQSQDTLHARIAYRFGELKDVVQAHRQLCDLFEDEFSGSTQEVSL